MDEPVLENNTRCTHLKDIGIACLIMAVICIIEYSLTDIGFYLANINIDI